MAENNLGKIFNFTTWGESHGKAIGCVVDGVPSQIPLSENDIQKYLDKRRPGQTKYTSQRKESDKINILSGTFNGLTTGHPISLLINNEDQRSKDYSEIKNVFRPGHADYTYWSKYKIRDYRGGGRSSARETAMRVAAGAVARKVLETKINNKFKITGALIQIGSSKIDYKKWNDDFIEKNDFFSPDKDIIIKWEDMINKARKDGSSLGAIIEIRCTNVPVGLGEPVYGKLDADLAKAMMSINAVKGVEIGNGFNSVLETGISNVDEMFIKDGVPQFSSNNNGGILGGISSGQDIILRFCVKPTSSILTKRKTINEDLQETEISTTGRHDPCVGIRAVPVGEAMMATTLADHFLRNI
ncbi:MAG: Chorismate synthase [Alphaproteobacteria bacterium MarineAlpha5_Bin8]|nr:MAG: Chorismate synthase [Alphaproteobacteria bacterium MarineAlpha5_Bin7]PPR48412.1 MAG: Chorismate synthase [Alphaproteobacteria bacterium MarineAlpha5_Bin8]PPR54409.1 MAG: Chorismate synthase [Alphaproteobacteria bacterium MarineAlpha5_Bin6]|tara:strand:- start:1467 stop:2537 length:1071 start_codon:yes stop_codon:yes gene_type:complete